MQKPIQHIKRKTFTCLLIGINALVTGPLLSEAKAEPATYNINSGVAPDAIVSNYFEINQTPNGRREYLFPALNDYGDVVGRIAPPPGSEARIQSHSAVWRDGIVNDLGMRGCEYGVSICASRALGINNAGLVVGASHSERNAALWGPNGLTYYYEHEYRALPGQKIKINAGAGWEWGWSKDVNERGITVGSGRSDRFGINDYLVHGFVWYNDYAVLIIGDYNQASFANAINERIQVTGSIDDGGLMVAYIYADKQVSLLGHLGGGRSEGEDINNATPAQVVGVSETGSGEQHAFLWNGETLLDLGTLGGATSHARAINDAGQIVGYATLNDGSARGTLWQEGQIYDLNDYIAADSGWVIEDAYDINAQGEILVRAVNGEGQAYLLLSPPGVVRPVRAGTGAGTYNPLPMESLQQIGTSYSDSPIALVTDEENSVYHAGSFIGTLDFDPSDGEYLVTKNYRASFVSKRDADNNHLWTLTLGGNSSFYNGIAITDLAVDAENNLYVVGDVSYGCFDFDPGPAINQLCSNFSSFYRNAYIAKYSSTGQFVWVKAFTGYVESFARDVAVDGVGNVTLLGYTKGYQNTDLDPGVGIVNAPGGSQFLVTLDVNGNYASSVVGLAGAPTQLAVLNTGGILVGGEYSGTVDFDPGAGVTERTADETQIGNSVYNNGFVARFDSDGQFLWVRTYLSDLPGNKINLKLAAHDGNAIVWAENTLEKLNTQGSVIWSTPTTGLHASMAVNAAGQIYISGLTQGATDFDPGSFEDIKGRDGIVNFTTHFDSNGNYKWTNVIQDAQTVSYHIIKSTAVDKLGSLYMLGEFNKTIIEPDSGLSLTADKATYEYDVDLYYAKFAQ